MFRVQARDQAGNLGLARTVSFKVDTVSPGAGIDSGPSGLVGSRDASFAFSSADTTATFECALAPSKPTFTACSSATSYTALVDGTYTFQVRARDAAGNVGASVSRTFTVDATGPLVTVQTAPTALTRDTSPVFAFSTSETASSSCSLVPNTAADSFSACTSPVAYSGLADGRTGFAVKSVDPAGNVSAVVTKVFVVDTTAPARCDHDQAGRVHEQHDTHDRVQDVGWCRGTLLAAALRRPGRLRALRLAEHVGSARRWDLHLLADRHGRRRQHQRAAEHDLHGRHRCTHGLDQDPGSGREGCLPDRQRHGRLQRAGDRRQRHVPDLGHGRRHHGAGSGDLLRRDPRGDAEPDSDPGCRHGLHGDAGSTVKDRAGNTLAPLTWTFVTGPRPTAVVKPGQNTTGILVTTKVTATFSEPVDGVTTSSFTLKDAAGDTVERRLCVRPGYKVATLTPAVALNAGTGTPPA